MEMAPATESAAILPPAARVRIFISYCNKVPDSGLALKIYKGLETAGYRPFMATEDIRLGDRWPVRIDEALDQCDYLLLLLTERSAVSEMVIEEIRKAKVLRDTRGVDRPVILPIRVDLPAGAHIDYDLASYLARIQQWNWAFNSDPELLIDDLLAMLNGRLASLQTYSSSMSAPRSSNGAGPPLPTAEPELPEGQVDLASAFYIERPPIESSCFQMIERPGALIRIKAPRQMGKTSLMARILRHAWEQEHRTVALSLQLADSTIFSDLDELLIWFCSSITWSLDIEDRLAGFWRLTGSKMRATAYFERYLLPEVAAPLTLGLDELDLVFQKPEVAADFFGLLRAWHEAGKSNLIWKRLRLIIVHSTEVYIPLQMNQSPFNVGLPVALPEFTPVQVKELARQHALPWGASEIGRLMAMIGGHPFLVRIALYYIGRQETTLNQLLATASTEGGLYGDHLRRHLWNLEKYPDLAAALRQVVSTPEGVRLNSEEAFKLESMGLVTLHGNEVTPRCELYRSYFNDHLRQRK